MNILWDNFLKAKTLAKIASGTSEKLIPRELKYGILTSVLLTAGFLSLNSINVKGGIYIFPLLYFLFLSPGIYYTLWKLSPTGKQNSIEYFTGLWSGVLTSFVAVIIYSVLIASYITVNTDAFKFVDVSSPFGIALNPYTAALSLFFEGIAFGVIITFSLMQYFKLNKN